MAVTLSLREFNSLAPQACQSVVQYTCGSAYFASLMCQARPFASLDEINQTIERIWPRLEEKDLLQAFAGHPKIGDRESMAKKFASTASLAENEQSATATASQQCLDELATVNQHYEDKFGFIFIICASGLSAEFMLSELRRRLANSYEEELAMAANEQLKITLLRFSKLLNPATEAIQL